MIISLMIINIILDLIILLILMWVAIDTDEIFSIKKELKILRRLINEQRKSHKNGIENSGSM